MVSTWLCRISGVHLLRWPRTKNMIFGTNTIFQLHHSTRPLLGHLTWSECSYYHKTIIYVRRNLRKVFWACSRVHKRSPWFVENGRSVRHSAQMREPRRCWEVIAWGGKKRGTRQGYLVHVSIWIWLPRCFASQNRHRELPLEQIQLFDVGVGSSCLVIVLE